MKKNEESPKTWLNPIWLLFLWIIIWGVWLFYSKNNITDWTYTLGTWWDSFWAINSLTSIVVLYFVFSSYKLQKKELEDTKNEMREQGFLFKKDNFENTFFKLIETLNIIDNLVLGVVKWLECLSSTTWYWWVFWNKNLTKDFYEWNDFQTAAEILKTYFNRLEIILKLIQSNGFPKESENFYINILKSKITKYELQTIASYYELYFDESNEYHVLIKWYGFIN